MSRRPCTKPRGRSPAEGRDRYTGWLRSSAGPRRSRCTRRRGRSTVSRLWALVAVGIISAHWGVCRWIPSEPAAPRSGIRAASAGRSSPATTTAAATLATAPDPIPSPARATVVRARAEIVRGVSYSRAYAAIDSVSGDVPSDRGACTDLVVRALRAAGLDLQARVFDDVASDPAAYGLVRADATVDHRRVVTLLRWFERHYVARAIDSNSTDFRPGDVVFYSFRRCVRRGSCIAEHVAIVGDRRGRSGRWMLLQNGGPRASENDALARGTLVGHFRPFPAL